MVGNRAALVSNHKTMAYVIGYRKSSQHPIEYRHERELHLTSMIADAVLLKGYELLEIQSSADSFPLTKDMVFARRDAKAAYCRARGDNQYEREEAFAIELFDAAYPSN
jgi:hypothetical protein